MVNIVFSGSTDRWVRSATLKIWLVASGTERRLWATFPKHNNYKDISELPAYARIVFKANSTIIYDKTQDTAPIKSGSFLEEISVPENAWNDGYVYFTLQITDATLSGLGLINPIGGGYTPTPSVPITPPLIPGVTPSDLPDPPTSPTKRTFELYIDMPHIGINLIQAAAWINKPVNHTITGIEKTDSGYKISYTEDFPLASASYVHVAFIILSALVILGVISWKIIETTNNTRKLNIANNAQELAADLIQNPSRYSHMTPEQRQETANKLLGITQGATPTPTGGIDFGDISGVIGLIVPIMLLGLLANVLKK